MKPALYYAIRINYGNDVVAVTSERTTRRNEKRWAGRYVKDNTATHGGMTYGHSDIIGKFATQGEAEYTRKRMLEIHDEFKERREFLSKKISELWSQERIAVDKLINGIAK